MFSYINFPISNGIIIKNNRNVVFKEIFLKTNRKDNAIKMNARSSLQNPLQRKKNRN